MGLEIKKSEFTRQDYERFTRRLFANLDELAQLLREPGFGLGGATLGAELELYIVDKLGRPLPVNSEVQKQLGDPQLTLELNRYNLEYNLTPVGIEGRPFSAIEAEIRTILERLNELAQPFDGRVLPIGILPTLQRKDFGLHAMTDLSRYHALTRALAEMRGETVAIRIDGEDPISLRASDVTLEGANTSLQMHYRVTPQQFADSYNAIQLVTPLVLAISANSPFLLGNRLWHETRVPLFKQAIDGSGNCSVKTGEAERVSFGHGWVRHGVHELFAEAVYLHKPILPVCESGHRRTAKTVGDADNHSLFELTLHQGTVWPWNRPVYDPVDGGHLRIEIRSLPAGPSPCDMMANAALIIGLAEGLRGRIEEIIPAMPFKTLEYNFYQAARFGMGAQLMWPSGPREQLTRRAAVDIVAALLPVARKGLLRAGIDAAEADHYLRIIRQRLQAKTNGACWQLRQFERLSASLVKRRALRSMLEHYIDHCGNNRPVAEWEDI
ncbi:Gamma-glutamyl:cysteine ligase YbdK, ATP-grasp superfamily [Amphritea atlantica]|uniref:Gamma-glutamyl:cysteine ligase YbdK, ATP-grasp superfamily n=1 Tax=Amphritea atlantica TaxID=355243 RepID=A0A1H9JNZ8_9GAMM|nr:glutamate--cysteine ligase [Amphritea atlantica]SEQ88582.1 Gamma-glutamyl:cysteine ligase YbdK, ATP-grasp superfamily [Amphritea atlantica]